MFGAVGLLLLAIAAEVGSTSVLSRADGFRDPLWTSVVLGGYAFSIWLLAIVVRVMPISTAYAVWSGLGTAAIAVIGALWLGKGNYEFNHSLWHLFSALITVFCISAYVF